MDNGTRTVPHQLQAEESLLGAMLLSKQAIADGLERCSDRDFYRPAHGHIFAAILALYAQGEPADPVTVADELGRQGLLENVGGLPFLLDLQGNTPAISNAHRYAQIVEEHALLRRLIGVGSEIVDLGYSHPGDIEMVVDQAETLVFAVAERRSVDSTAVLHDLLDDAIDHLGALYERDETITGVPTGFLDLDQKLLGLQKSTLTIIGARPSMGKALALDTPLPTPTGWTTMEAVRVGDEVIDSLGRSCRVTYTSPVFVGNRCYRLTFDDGSQIVADAGHQWLAYDFAAWKSHRTRSMRLAAGPPANPKLARDQSAKVLHPRVVTTQDMVDDGVRSGNRPNWYIPLAGALDLPERDLPVDPYVLGCWLGDGTTTGSGMTIHPRDADEHFIAEFTGAGYILEPRPNCSPLTWATVPVPGTGKYRGYRGPHRVLTRELQAVGLLGGHKKHIPAPYMRASRKQRIALLQGLLDTDGTVTNNNGTVDLCLANLDLLEQAREIVVSLGHKPFPIVRRKITMPSGSEAEAWRFRWTPLEPVFRLERKARRLSETVSRRRNGKATRRSVVAIEEIQSVPVRCIAVDAADHLFLAGRSMIPTHNTSLALGVAAHAASVAQVPTLVFSLEMSHRELTSKLLASEARVDATRLRNGKLQEQDWGKISHAIGRLAEAPLHIDDNPAVTLMDIRAKARRVQSKLNGTLGLIIIDYLQLMSGRRNSENRQVEIAEISRGLKILARELDLPVVALCQLNRSLEARADKRPMLADLRESGSLEQDADVVLFVYRDEVYNAESPDRGTAEIIIAKHRNGPTGVCRLAWLDHYTRFANMAHGI